jgi:hypothetical protein
MHHHGGNRQEAAVGPVAEMVMGMAKEMLASR